MEPTDSAEATTDEFSSRDGFASGSEILGGQFILTELVEGGNATSGAPAVWKADGPAASFIAKTWGRPDVDDIATRTVWNHEVRSLLKLGGLPRSHEHFAGLEALGADERGFYVVVDGGGRTLLSSALADRNAHGWLRSLAQQSVRARLWDGLRRLAVGLDMLHDQGTLHRALRPGCVFTDVQGSCDFRLSGFEWSLRLSAAALDRNLSSGPARLRAPELDEQAPAYSIASDWFDFGLVAAELLVGARPTGRGLEALDAVRQAVKTSKALLEIERNLVLGFLTPNPDARRVECAEAAKRVGALATHLGMDERSRDRPVLLAVHLSSGSELAQAIFQLSGGRIRINDGAAQLEFIKQDLAKCPTVTVRSASVPHYVLHGSEISYRVAMFSDHGPPSWRAGFCSGLDKGARDPGRSEGLQAARYVSPR